MSLKVGDLVKEAVELEEDIALSTFAEKMEQTFKPELFMSNSGRPTGLRRRLRPSQAPR